MRRRGSPYGARRTAAAGWLIAATLGAFWANPAQAVVTAWEKMYDAAVLESTAANAQKVLTESLQNWIVPALPPEQRVLASSIRISVPRESDGMLLNFYARHADKTVLVPASSLRLVGDLLYAWAWLTANGNSPETVLAYLSMLKYQYAGQRQVSTGLSPHAVLGIPARVRDDPVLRQQVDWQFNSAMFFILCHEVGHIVLGHRVAEEGLAPSASRAQELEADAFALNIMRSIGQSPEGPVFLLLFASVLEPFVIDDKALRPFPRTHPLGVDRVTAISSYIKANARGFARVQADPTKAAAHYADMADQIEVAVKGVLDDLGTQQRWRSLGLNSTPTSLGPRPGATVAAPVFKDATSALGPSKSRAAGARLDSIEGRWTDESAILNRAYYDFRPDSSYSFVSLFQGVSPKIEIEVREEGRYTTQGDQLTLSPTKKVYKKNGVEEPDTPREQAFRWAVKPAGSARTLELVKGNSKFAYRSE
jgi:Peptidase U49